MKERFNYPVNTEPDITTLQNMNINHFLLGSVASSIISAIIIFLGFNDIELKIKIIIILSIICLILLVNLIALYIRDCQNYFVVCFQNSKIKEIEKKVENIKNSKN